MRQWPKGIDADLLLNGYVAFFEPPMDSATAAIKALQGCGIEIKVVTADNELVAKKVCKEVGLPPLPWLLLAISMIEG